jgi:hypothetical protein
MDDKQDFVIFQFPNKYLWIMIITWPLSYFLSGYYSFLARAIFDVAAVVWAYLEIVDGANWFRNLLGIAVMATIIIGIATGLNH